MKIKLSKKLKNNKNTFPDFLILLSGTCEPRQLSHDTDSKNLEWGLHNDINSIFPDFGEFQNFLTHMKI